MRKGFVDTPTDIRRCLRSPETTEHYLIHCDLYTEPRINMFHVINPILEFHGLYLRGDLLINLLLYGNNTVSYDDYKAILTATLKFIIKSTRFETCVPTPLPPPLCFLRQLGADALSSRWFQSCNVFHSGFDCIIVLLSLLYVLLLIINNKIEGHTLGKYNS